MTNGDDDDDAGDQGAKLRDASSEDPERQRETDERLEASEDVRTSAELRRVNVQFF